MMKHHFLRFIAALLSVTVSGDESITRPELNSANMELEDANDGIRILIPENPSTPVEGRGETSFATIFRHFKTYDLPEHDLPPMVTNVHSPAHCASICLERLQEGCTGFTWVAVLNDFHATCFPKRGFLSERDLVQPTVPNWVVSGFIQPITVTNEGLSYPSYLGRDYYSNDLKVFEGVTSAEDCARKIEVLRASGFTWLGSKTKFPNKCFLKTGAPILSHLSEFEGAVTGFVDSVGASSEFRYFADQLSPSPQHISYLVGPFFSNDPLACASSCRERYQGGCRGFNWRPNFTGDDQHVCQLLGGALTGRDLDVPLSSGYTGRSVFGMLLPVCTKQGYKVFTGTRIANDRVPILTAAIQKESTSRFFFERNSGAFYDFKLSNGDGQTRVFDGIFDLSLLVLDDSSSTSVPCVTPICSGGFRIISSKSVSVNAAVERSGISESACRALSTSSGSDYTYYSFRSTGKGVGVCQKYSDSLNESFLVDADHTWIGVPC